MFDQGNVAGAVAEDRAAIALMDNDGPIATEQLRLGQALEQLGKDDEALAAYRKCLTVAVASSGRDAMWDQVLAETHERIGHVLDGRGDHAGVVAERRAALAAELALATRQPDNTAWQNELVHYHDALGGALEPDDPKAALDEYRAAEAIGEHLVAHDPTNLDWQRALLVSHEYAAAMLVALGNVDDAIALYRAILAELEPRASRDRDNAALQRDLYHVHSAFGDALVMHDDAAALREYQAALAIVEVSAAREPTNVPRQMDLAVTRNRVAGSLVDRGDVAAGLASYRTSAAALAALVQRVPQDVNVRHAELAASLGVGEALLKDHQRDAAVAQYRDAMAIASAVAGLAPSNPLTAQDLVAAHTGLGDALLVGHASDAAAEYRAAIALAQTAGGPTPSIDWRDSLTESHRKLGDALAASHQPASAEYRAALVLAVGLAAADPTNADWKTRVATLRQRAK
jgi:tetratricopeptide (TPR) repeat protein